MPEIWNLNALCRCCHTDGNFKTIDLPHIFKENIENYEEMLKNTFSLNLAVPQISASYMICDACISSLRDAAQFREQIVACEKNFEEYVKNELSFLAPSDIKEEVIDCDIKEEHAPNCKKVTIKIELEDALKSELPEIPVELHSDKSYDDDLPITRLDKSALTDLKCVAKESKPSKKDIATKLKPKSGIKKIVGASRPRKFKRTRTSKCEVCLKEMLLKELRDHVKTHPGPFSCRYCEQQFEEYGPLKKHILLHADRLYSCHLCEKSYKNANQLAAHINVHTRQNVFTCDICNKEFLYKSILRRHIEVHKGEKRTDKRYRCPHCCKMFNNNSYLTAHIQTVHEMLKSFECPLCPKKYAAKKTLTVHFRIHTGELPYRCEICEEGFRSFSLLRYHRQKIHVKKQGHVRHRNSSEDYQCKRCDAHFTHKGLYIAHLKTHAPKGLMCEQCGKGFYCSYTLKRHILNHSGYKPFACELCTKKYTTKFQLQRHVRKQHDKIVTKYKCEVCGKDVENLPQHMKTHNNRRFACEYCDRTYPQLNTLNRHVKELHSGDKLFGCDFCSKRFVKKRSLQKHKCKAIKDEQISKSDCVSVTSS